MPRIAGIVGKSDGLGHTENVINLCPHKREPLGRLLVFERNAAMQSNGRNRVVAFHQCALRAAAINLIAREATSPTTAESSDRSGSRATMSARHAATLAPAGAVVSLAMAAKTRRGSIVAGS